MTKPKKLRDSRMEAETDERVLTPESFPVVPGAKPRVYCPPPCSTCTAIRPANTNYTRTNGTETRENTQTELVISRACKCHYCGTTWTDKEVIKHNI